MWCDRNYCRKWGVRKEGCHSHISFICVEHGESKMHVYLIKSDFSKSLCFTWKESSEALWSFEMPFRDLPRLPFPKSAGIPLQTEFRARPSCKIALSFPLFLWRIEFCRWSFESRTEGFLVRGITKEDPKEKGREIESTTLYLVFRSSTSRVLKFQEEFWSCRMDRARPKANYGDKRSCASWALPSCHPYPKCAAQFDSNSSDLHFWDRKSYVHRRWTYRNFPSSDRWGLSFSCRHCEAAA